MESTSLSSHSTSFLLQNGTLYHYVITAHFLLLLAPGIHHSASLFPDTPGPSLMHNHSEHVFCDYLTSYTTNSWALILCVACVKVCFLFNIKEYNTLSLHCHTYKNSGWEKFRASLSLNTQVQGFLPHLGLPIHCLVISVFLILQMCVLHVGLKLIRTFSYKLHPSKELSLLWGNALHTAQHRT